MPCGPTTILRAATSFKRSLIATKRRHDDIGVVLLILTYISQNARVQSNWVQIRAFRAQGRPCGGSSEVHPAKLIAITHCLNMIWRWQDRFGAVRTYIADYLGCSRIALAPIAWKYEMAPKSKTTTSKRTNSRNGCAECKIRRVGRPDPS